MGYITIEHEGRRPEGKSNIDESNIDHTARKVDNV